MIKCSIEINRERDVESNWDVLLEKTWYLIKILGKNEKDCGKGRIFNDF